MYNSLQNTTTQVICNSLQTDSNNVKCESTKVQGPQTQLEWHDNNVGNSS